MVGTTTVRLHRKPPPLLAVKNRTEQDRTGGDFPGGPYGARVPWLLLWGDLIHNSGYGNPSSG